MKRKTLHTAFASALFLCTPVSHASEPAISPTPAEDAAPDFGDSSSATLTTMAWNALNEKTPAKAQVFARKCIDSFGTQALAMQKTLTEPTSVKEETEKLWALNDVGTCYFILGQSLEADGKKKEALVAYKTLVDTLPYAQCWDTKGWYWKPADAARDKVKALEFDALE